MEPFRDVFSRARHYLNVHASVRTSWPKSVSDGAESKIRYYTWVQLKNNVHRKCMKKTDTEDRDKCRDKHRRQCLFLSSVSVFFCALKRNAMEYQLDRMLALL